MNAQPAGDTFNVGSVSVGGQGAVGKDINQIGENQGGTITIGQAASVAQPQTTEAELLILQRMFESLKAKVEIEAPPDKQPAALERLAELQDAVTAKKPDFSTMEYVKNWFVKNLPTLSGAVASLVFHPIVGKLVEAAGDEVVSEFRDRFGSK
ncbi:MAG TPA: hypothetical protein V6D16_02610 [Candidatus Obscuribacterales bacterium]